MDAWIYEWMDGRKVKVTDRWMTEWIGGCIEVRRGEGSINTLRPNFGNIFYERR